MAGTNHVATADFAFGNDVYTHQHIYNDSEGRVAAAVAAVPQLFMAAGGSKVATTSFVFKDSRGGGTEKYVRVGETFDSADPAVTGAPANFA